MFRRSKMFEHNQQLLDYMTIPKRSPEDYNEQHYNMEMVRNEDPETKSGATESMEPPSGDEDHQDPNHHSNKRKHYHRHTPEQIKEMELVFKKSPHPDDKKRKELGQRLGLEPLQVKFWFQNKRTQKKALLERNDNSLLRKENEKLREENKKLKTAVDDFTCPSCDGSAAMGEMSFDEQQLKIENDRLREELHRLSEIAAKYVEKPILSYPFDPAHVPRSLDLGVGSYEPLPSINVADPILSVSEFLRSVSGPTEADKQTIIELAVAAMEELIGMTQAGEPLWILSNDNSTEILCEDEYMTTFPKLFGPKLFGLKSEASRHSAVVLMNHVNLVDILMDVNQWSNIFSGIVSRATTLDVLSTGVEGNYNGVLQVMTAEFQVPSPLVPTRENYFVRYCKQLDNGTWVVADISLDGLHPTLISRCRRRPSGCLIQELPNGYSKVTWVEHVEVDERAINNIYRSLLDSGLAFGAKRWVATLNRQCERLASAMVNNVPGGHNGVISSSEGRNSILKLAERMVLSFCSGVGASTYYQTWTTLPGIGSDDVKVMTRRSTDDPGKPRGILLNAATSLWIPASPRRVFGFLRDENFRSEWDILSNGGLVQEVAHIASGRDPGNCVSLLRVDSALSSQTNMLILQESSTDPTASYVVYSPVDVASMNGVLRGGDPDYVALLPSGFAIFPDGNGHTGGGMLEDGSVGSLLTIAFQILVDSVPTAKLSPASVSTVNRLIKRTVERIKDELLFDEKVMIHMQ